jgi:phosphoribosylamine--glycine ligase
MKALVIGGGGREHAMVKALRLGGATVLAAMKHRNPGIAREAEDHLLGDETAVGEIVSWAKTKGADFAAVGPEAPLAAGIVDALEAAGIPAFGPTQAAAEIEASKEFARRLMEKHRIPGLIDYRAFRRPGEVEAFLRKVDYDVVVKPAGLTGGKGVRVMGDHFGTYDEAISYAKQVLKEDVGGRGVVLIERKEVGEEFSLQAFCDGRNVVPMPAVQDYKRAYEHDRGPNTGGMGSISQEDGLLPFLPRAEYERAVKILQRTVDAMAAEGRPFKGVLYGGFVLTREGPKVLEFNARFADPESMNVLAILKDSFPSVAEAVAFGELRGPVAFLRRATVCKYVVPEGYGTRPLEGQRLEVDEEAIRKEGAELFYASVDARPDGLYTTSSRALAILGVAGEITKAYTIAEDCLKHVKGKLYVRHDIGHPDTVRAKVRRMREVRRGKG